VQAGDQTTMLALPVYFVAVRLPLRRAESPR
jgi:hypothetical protein